MRTWLTRLLYYAIPIAVIALSVATLNAGPYLKRPMGTEEPIAARVDRISDLALAGRWRAAVADVEGLQRDWERVRRRIRFISEGAEIRDFDQHVAELQGAVEAQDTKEVRIATRRLLAFWNDLGT